ncbi:MAG: hypothetical protein CFE43_01545 [Burkholderiales bacterium PBB3]|nr:MAG: hypothetical protein CFE43_01545 [Burkholderiales bacterium PBB3]
MAQSAQATGPESFSILRLPDEPGRPEGLHDRHRLGADLAAIFSLALDRRVVIPNDFAIQFGQQIHFQSTAQVVDQTIQGPLPDDAKSLVATYILAIAGLPPDDQDCIGAACTAYHGAILLFDREPRAAYTLLVTGIELLSRRYGSPPTEWQDWESSSEWDAFFDIQALSGNQASAFRQRLLSDKHLRLGQTFRTYASTRPRDSFWDVSVDQWISGTDQETGVWLAPILASSKKVSDFVGTDRILFRQKLASSYQLRSSVVHESKWIELLTLGQPFVPDQPQRDALSFPIIRKLLAELLAVELFDRASPYCPPDFQLLRQI